MKDNKLIAEFMGYRVFNKGTKCYSPKYNDGTIAPMQFHTSWDWLMPVLKKIKRQIPPNNMGMWRQVTQPIEYDIHEVHQEAVEFIKRYSNE